MRRSCEHRDNGVEEAVKLAAFLMLCSSRGELAESSEMLSCWCSKSGIPLGLLPWGRVRARVV